MVISLQGAEEGDPVGEPGWGQGVTLASWESSALTPIFTPLTLISRTQLEGGLKCTVSRRVVAICGEGQEHQAGVSLSQERTGTGLGVGTHFRGAGSRYLLHSGTEDVIALVVGNLDRAQELHPKLVHPVAVFGQGWKASMKVRRGRASRGCHHPRMSQTGWAHFNQL